MDLILFLTARLSLWKDTAMVIGVSLHVGGAWGGMVRLVWATFNEIVALIKYTRLTVMQQPTCLWGGFYDAELQ